jgi:hypothetical protein
MKKLLSWGGVSLLTGAILDPVAYSCLGMPVPWGRDLVMATAGALCIYLLVRLREEL